MNIQQKNMNLNMIQKNFKNLFFKIFINIKEKNYKIKKSRILKMYYD